MRVLVVEASSGGVVGGSLTGLYHMIRGFDRGRYQFGMVLYEKKALEPQLASLGVPVFHVARRRLPKEHPLQRVNGYHAARRWRLLRTVLHAGRTAGATLIEDLPSAFRIAQVLRSFRPDVVHVGNGLRANFDALLACWLTSTPVVCHVKGFEKYGARERWIAGRTSAIVCMTEAVRQHCRQHGITHERLLVIYDALDPADFVPRRSREDVRGELGIPAHAPVAGVVGNIQEWKGQLVFVDALSRVRERIPEVRGVIVGGVHRAGQRYYDRLLARVRELRLGDAIIVTGFRTDVPDVMHALDVVVHTSVRPEPFGRVILEGMLCGKPVVASAAGGVPELIEHGRTGLLVPPGDAAALADAIETLLGDTAVRTAMGEEARRATEERFRLARHVAEFEQLYRALGEERQGSCAS